MTMLPRAVSKAIRGVKPCIPLFRILQNTVPVSASDGFLSIGILTGVPESRIRQILRKLL